MKNNSNSNSSGTKRAAVFSAEKILLGLFAAFSLAFTLVYTFKHNVTHAETPKAETSAPAAPDSSAPIAPKSFSADIASNPNADAAVADVVAKALAFKNSLTAAQQATLEKTYTAQLARKWSNLPCGATCRNGIQFSTLTSAQLDLALQVIQAAAGTAASEGYDEFNQIRLADAYLGSNGGGSGYSSGIYFISFLNTPTTGGPWMLQFGGHHYAANIGFNQGHYISATPYFMGVEPTTFTTGGTTYAPLEQERGALQNMLASFTSAQLTTARLTQTYSDVTMSPGESNGGNGTFPATRVGIPVSSLSDAQKLLVLEAIKPYAKDVDDTVAANLLRIYQNELNSTYVAYTGTGTSGTAGSFLNANTNYVRIDGPSVWIEFICQNGAVFRNQIHYHTIWRDRQRDYGVDLSLTTPLDTPAANASTAYDFDGDAKADVSVFRSSSATWYLNRSTSGFGATTFGVSSDKIIPADYDGDGKTDIAVFRNGAWFTLRSSDNTFSYILFGDPGDVPVPGDYDGDGRVDQAVFRAGTWYLNRSTSGFGAVSFGIASDKPVAADYDGDNKTDIAVFRSGYWYILRSSDGTFAAVLFGDPGDVPIVADYDGDGKDDVAVFRQGNWYLNRSTSGFASIAFGISSDTPVPADYDGDAKADVAVFRSGVWYLNRSTAGFASVSFGDGGDTPVPAAYLP